MRKSRQFKAGRCYHLVGLILICLTLGFVGCAERKNSSNGAPVAIEHKKAERVRQFEIEGDIKTSKVSFDLEYPASFGLTAGEHQRLVEYVNNVFNDGTNFYSSVDEVAKSTFEYVQSILTNKTESLPSNLDLTVQGKIVYADSRYVSYELNVHGLWFTEIRSSYDRQLGRSVQLNDLIAVDKMPVLRLAMRKYIHMVMPMNDSKGAEDPFANMPKDWPQLKDDFTIHADGLRWSYLNNELAIGANMEIRVGWDELKDAVSRDSLPTGSFSTQSSPVPVGNGDGWRIPVVRIDRVPSNPPAELFVGTNYPYASIMCSIEDPVNSGIAPEKFAAFQKCIGTSICPHSRWDVVSVKDGLSAALYDFWDKYLKKVRQGKFAGAFAVLAISAKVAYRGPEYVGYEVEYQDGCPCCAGVTNVVWSWEKNRSLTSADFVRADSVQRLRKMLRVEVKQSFADSYSDTPESVLPNYAKDWPYTLENFMIEESGVSWTCDAGEVLMGGKGPCSFLLTWKELAPVLREDFKLPTRLEARE